MSVPLPPGSPATRHTLPLMAVFCLVGLTLAWGLGWPMMKYAVGEIPLYTFRITTAWVGGLLVLALSALQGNPVTLPRHEWRPAALSAFFNVTCWFYFTALGLTLLPAGRAVVLAYTMPLFAIVIARVMLKEPITRRKTAGILLGVPAILMLLGDSVQRLGESPLGVLAMLAAAATWGVGTVVQKRVWQTPALTLIGWQLLMGGLPMAVMAAVHDRAPFAHLTFHGVLALVYVVCIATLLGFWAWFTILALAPASVASIAVLPVPLVGVLASAVVLGEPIGWQEMLALALITAALATVLPLPRPFRR
jgi:drug/metabolite transporter (DMT)-like permease